MNKITTVIIVLAAIVFVNTPLLVQASNYAESESWRIDPE